MNRVIVELNWKIVLYVKTHHDHVLVHKVSEALLKFDVAETNSLINVKILEWNAVIQGC